MFLSTDLILDLCILQITQQQRRSPRIPHYHDDPRLCPRTTWPLVVRLVCRNPYSLDHAQHWHDNLLLRAHCWVSMHPGIHFRYLSCIRSVGDWLPQYSAGHQWLRLSTARTYYVPAFWLRVGEHADGRHRGCNRCNGPGWTEDFWSEAQGQEPSCHRRCEHRVVVLSFCQS